MLLTSKRITLFYLVKALNLSDRSHRLSFQISQNIDTVSSVLTICS